MHKIISLQFYLIIRVQNQCCLQDPSEGSLIASLGDSVIEKFEDGNEEERMRYSKPELISDQWALSSVALPSQHTSYFFDTIFFPCLLLTGYS